MAPKERLSRRQFMKVTAVGCMAAGLAWQFGERGADLALGRIPEAVRETHLLMGTAVTFTLVGDHPEQANRAAEAALSEMRRLVGIFSRFDPASQLSRLNTAGVLRSPDPVLVDLLQQAEALHRASGGAFDVTVQPLYELYRRARTLGGNLPAAGEIRAALKRVDTEQVFCDEGEVGFARKGMCLTLDGIAKGAVIDGGARVLREHGFDNVIVEAGGDLLASGAYGPAAPWKVGLRAPRPDSGLTLPVLQVQNRAVATSGDYLQPFADDFSAHHILDPRRGFSSPELASVTIIAPRAALADALATAVMVAGVKDGLSLLEQYPGCEGYLVQKDLQAVTTPGMAAYLA